MTLMMSGLDYQRTPLNQRQRLAFSTSQAEELLHWLHDLPCKSNSHNMAY